MNDIPQQKVKGNWSGYKLVTIIVSIIMVIVVITQFAYNHYYTHRWQEINYSESKIAQYRQDLEKLLQRPKVEMLIHNFEENKLFKTIIKKFLSEIPQSVALYHVGGETAEGIILMIKSSEPILKFQKWESPEDFSVEQINKNTIKLNSTQLRKGATIGIIIYTKKTTKLETQLFIDKGEKIQDWKKRKPFNDSNPLRYLKIEDYDKLIDMYYKGFSDEALNIKKEMFLLESKVENLKSQNFFSWIKHPIGALILMMIFFAVVGIGIVYFVSIKPELKLKSMRNQVLNEIKNKDFMPETIFDLIERLGAPSKVEVSKSEIGTKFKLFWFSKTEFVSFKSLQFTIQNNSIVEIFDGDLKIAV